MITIIKGVGYNLTSICCALQRLGCDWTITSDPEQIKAATRVLLPGVGSFDNAMERLSNLDLIETIKSLNQPVLGICLGMQLLFESSEEGAQPGLRIIPGKVEKLLAKKDLPVPHMGWSQLAFTDGSDPILNGIPEDSFCYFVHSYGVKSEKNAVTKTCYGQGFYSMVRRDNFLGMQFHPEKSATVGEALLRNFLNQRGV